jgi:propanediol dehydratase small subunit
MEANKHSSYQYPLREHHADVLHTGTGVPLAALTVDDIASGRLGSDDLRISADTLEMQAEIAAGAGYAQLEENLRRAAELARVPADEILRIYKALRPGRSTYAELQAAAANLEQRFAARRTAAFVRDAAEAYRAHGLLRPTPSKAALS